MTQTTLTIENASLKADLESADKHLGAWQNLAAKTNAALYAVMAGAFTIAETYLLEELQKAAKANGIKYLSTTTAIGLAVKLVFRDIDRQKASAYTVVITMAKNANVTSADLVSWIDTEGGIEKIRKATADVQSEVNKAANADALDDAKALINGRYMAGYHIAAPNKAQWKFDTNADTKTAVWHVCENAAGGFDLLSVHTDGDLLKSIATKYGKALKAEKPEQHPYIKVVSKAPLVNASEQDDAIARVAEQK